MGPMGFFSNPKLRDAQRKIRDIVTDIHVSGVGGNSMNRSYFWHNPPPIFSGVQKRKFYNGAKWHFLLCHALRNLPMEIGKWFLGDPIDFWKGWGKNVNFGQHFPQGSKLAAFSFTTGRNMENQNTPVQMLTIDCLTIFTPNLVGVDWIIMENAPIYTWGRPFYGSPATASQISVKLCVDIICRTETWTIQSYSPGGVTFPDCFAIFSNPVEWQRLPCPRFSRSIGLIWDLTFNYGLLGAHSMLDYFWASPDRLLSWNFHADLATALHEPVGCRCSCGPARSLQPGWTGYGNPRRIADWLHSFCVCYRYVDGRERVWNGRLLVLLLLLLLNLDWIVVAAVSSTGIWKSS